MKLATRWARFKYRNDKTAEQCPGCERIELNPGPFPFLMCDNEHRPLAMHRINR